MIDDTAALTLDVWSPSYDHISCVKVNVNKVNVKVSVNKVNGKASPCHDMFCNGWIVTTVRYYNGVCRIDTLVMGQHSLLLIP